MMSPRQASVHFSRGRLKEKIFSFNLQHHSAECCCCNKLVYPKSLKVYEQLVEGILIQVLDDIEDERVKQGRKHRIVLNSALPYVILAKYGRLNFQEN